MFSWTCLNRTREEGRDNMKKQEAANVINITSIKAACKDCSLHELCLPLGLGESDLAALDNTVKRRRTLRKGEMLIALAIP